MDSEVPYLWKLQIDDASDLKGSSVKVVLKAPSNILIDKSLKSESRVSNNQIEYESLIGRMNPTVEMGVLNLRAQKDS